MSAEQKAVRSEDEGDPLNCRAEETGPKHLSSRQVSVLFGSKLIAGFYRMDVSVPLIVRLVMRQKLKA